MCVTENSQALFTPQEKHKRNEEKTVPIQILERFSQGEDLLEAL